MSDEKIVAELQNLKDEDDAPSLAPANSTQSYFAC